MTEKILVVDDEEAIVDFVSSNLKKEGFNVVTANSGEEAIEKVQSESPDLVLLDVMLPEKDGFQVCKEIRGFTSVPIIMLTARDEDMDKIIGLEMGADDYVVKPFNPKELVARIKAIFRRLKPSADMVKDQKIKVLNLVLDVFRRKAFVSEKQVDLAPREYDLLLMLASNQNKLFSREEILREVWGYEYVDNRSVDVHIKYIREKLGKPMADCIQTVWGKGYKFVDISKPVE
jgi:two-component system response regulator ResD